MEWSGVDDEVQKRCCKRLALSLGTGTVWRSCGDVSLIDAAVCKLLCIPMLQLPARCASSNHLRPLAQQRPLAVVSPEQDAANTSRTEALPHSNRQLLHTAMPACRVEACGTCTGADAVGRGRRRGVVTGWEPNAGRGALLPRDSLAFFLALTMSSAVRGRLD